METVVKSEILENKNTARILCCECSTPFDPNSANICETCLLNHVDISEGIPKQYVLYFCRNCERYLQPPKEWIKCTLESKELLALCLKRVKGLKNVELIDAGFIWTEPHSKRLKVKLTIHGEIMGGNGTMQKIFTVDYNINNQMCDDCHRSKAKDHWNSVVQIRQRAENKKTFYYSEQIILKNKAHENTIGIKPIHGGLDFFYRNENHARKMVEFLQAALPVKTTLSKRLVSHNVHKNIYNYKYTFSIDIVPLSKDSLVCMPKKLQHQLGNISPLCLVLRVSNIIHLIDPITAQMAELYSAVFYRQPFDAIFNPKQFVEYIVMNIEVIDEKDLHKFPGQGPVSNKHVISDVWVVKASELGINDNLIHTRSHLGYVLKPGDSVLGYNLQDANINNDNFEKIKEDSIPDVILVKKNYDEVSKSNRIWKLKHLSDEMTSLDPTHEDYNEFLNDLECDPDLRQKINIYKDSSKDHVDTNDMENPLETCITLTEMLDDLDIDDVAD